MPRGQRLRLVEATGRPPVEGHLHAPGGLPTGVCPVRFVVGDWTRTLLAFGPRNWKAGAAAPEVAEPFVRLPLGWTESFGGAGFADNPVGRGFGGEILPRLEDERRPMRQRADTPAPAAFGPVNRAWPLRRRKTGSYGGDYVKARWPGLPLDFDWSYFNAAPAEQQVPYLKGDEKLIVQNVHPDEPIVGVRLPGWRPRCLVRQVLGGLRRGDCEVVLKELPLALDTLAVDMDAGALARLARPDRGGGRGTGRRAGDLRDGGSARRAPGLAGKARGLHDARRAAPGRGAGHRAAPRRGGGGDTAAAGAPPDAAAGATTAAAPAVAAPGPPRPTRPQRPPHPRQPHPRPPTPLPPPRPPTRCGTPSRNS